MKRLSLLCCSALLVFGCASKQATLPAPAATQDTRLPVDPNVITGQLDNGFRYIIRQNQKPENRAELRLAVNAGSVLENERQQGLAHFVEHMAFNGTKNFAKQELVDYLESIGMRFGPDLNAYTSFDETVYMLQVPTDSSGTVEKAFQIMEDWAHQVSFETEEIDKERGVVTEEWRLGRGASSRMRDKQLPIILQGSRYAQRLPIGQAAVIDTFDHEDLRAFYRDWYRPDLMGFVAVGDFEPAYIESLIQVYFSRIPAAQDPPERVVYPVPDHEETLFAIASDEEATRTIASIFYKQDVRPNGTLDTYRRSLIEGLYHAMFNKRLQELTQLADPPFLGAGSSQSRILRSKEFFTLGAAVVNNGIDRGLEGLLTEAARVRQHGFAATELARIKKQSLRGMEQAYRERDKTQSGAFAGAYVSHLLTDDPIPGIEKNLELYRELLPGIKLEEVNALASAWRGGRNRVIAVSSPDKEGVTVPTEADLLAVFETVAQKQIDPYVDDVSDAPIVAVLPRPATITASDRIDTLDVTRWKLSNGIEVFLKPTDFKNDQILFRSYSPGGHSLVDAADYIAASTAASIMDLGGVADFTLIELQKKLAGKVVGVSPWISGLQEGLSGSSSPEDVETMFELIHAYFTAPRPDSTAFQSFKARVEGAIQNRNLNPYTAYSDTLSRTLSQYHHRTRPWSDELLLEMDLEKSAAIYRDRFADAGDFAFFFVGNFELEQIKPLILTYIGGLPNTGRQESWKDVGIEAPTGVIEKFVYRGIEPKSQSSLVFTGPFDYDGWKNSFDLSAMASVLDIKLREVMREDLGGTYSVSVGASDSHFPDEEYSISISFGCDPDRVEELTQTIFTQIDSLKNAGTTDIYIDKVKEMRKRRREVQLKENGFWAGGLQWAHFNGIDPIRFIEYPAMVDSLTAEDVQQAAQQYFNMDNYVRVVLMPEDYQDKDTPEK